MSLDSEWDVIRWIEYAFLLLNMLAFSSSWGLAKWAVPGGSFPTPLRSKGVAVSMSAHFL